jgi:hypothetical protein
MGTVDTRLVAALACALTAQPGVDLPPTGKRRARMRVVALALCIAAIAAPAAFAKGRISVALGDSRPRAGQRFTVTVRTDYVVPPNDWLRLIAVAPGKDWYDVVGTVTGDSSLAHANIPHDGFEIKLVRVGPKSWRAVVRLPRPGRWRLVVPNGTHVGFMLPPPAAWMPWVHVHR